MNFLIRLILSAVAVLAAAYFTPGVKVEGGFWAAFKVAIALALLNTFVKPVLQFFAFPFTILTLGLFLFVINVIIIYLASYFVDGFKVTGFIPALIFSVIMSVATWILNAFAGND